MSRITSQLALLSLLAIGLAACEKTPEPTAPGTQPTLSASSTHDTHPALTFAYRSTDNHQRIKIAVSDSEGANQANVFTCHTGYSASMPTWSGDGENVSFTETNASNPWLGSSLRTVEVSVSHGVAHGSEPHTLIDFERRDSMYLRGQAWCKASGVNKIAYVIHSPSEEAIYLISACGGTPTKIYSIANADGHFQSSYYPNYQSGGLTYGAIVTWSGDGTKLAFVLVSDSDYSIKVINLSGNVVATPYSSSYAIDGIQWSHAGIDKIAFLKYGVGGDIATIGALDGSSPVFYYYGSPLSGYNVFWSPDNSELLFLDPYNYGYGTGKVNVEGPVYPVFPSSYFWTGDWKQP